MIFVTVAIAIMFHTLCWSAPIYNPATNHYYQVVLLNGPGSWQDAENEAIALGGHLVTINNAAEEAWLRATFSKSTLYWIGLTDSLVEGVWVWVSGEPVTYTNWIPGEPNNAKPPAEGEDYAVLNWNASTGGWNDYDSRRPDFGSYRIYGIAEITSVPSVPEPASMLLLGLGLLGLLGIRRNLKK